VQRKFITGLVAGAVFAAVALVHAQQSHDHAMHRRAPGDSAAKDDRTVVKFPEDLRSHTLANMRDHLLALQEIQDALAAQQFDKAADIAEQRLGMSSPRLHGAHEVARYMPEAMQNIGTEMHRAASRFAVTALEAGATGGTRPPLAALARVTQQCVACHGAYRVQ
jgi:hypothetical protein